jgi:hypothetical protein
MFPNEILMDIKELLPIKDRTNFCMVLNKGFDNLNENANNFRKHDSDEDDRCYKINSIYFFGIAYCREMCTQCMHSLPNGFCYLDMLTSRRLQVMMTLGAYPELRKIARMRVSLKNICVDDISITTSPGPDWVAEPVMSRYKGPRRLDREIVVQFKPRTTHLVRNRYSYGESEFERTFSPEEMNMFNENVIEDKTIDEQIKELLQEEEFYAYNEYYYLVGSGVFRKVDVDRDIMSSGYTAIEEAGIISNFKRRVDLGIPIEEAMKSSVGLDTWTIRRQGMCGVKRFIESRICDIARSYGKKPRRKLNQAQQDLLKRADESVLDEIIYDKEIKTKGLKDSITRSSLASVDQDKLKTIVPDLKIVKNKRSFDAESFCSISDMGNLINEIASKVGKDLDKISEHNKLDSRIDDMILGAEKVQGIYEDLLSYGNEKKDPMILKKSIEGIHNIYSSLVEDEIKSLERYGEQTKELVEEYKKNLMFDSIPDKLKSENYLKEINNLIDNIGEDEMKTKRLSQEELEELKPKKEEEPIIVSDDTDYSSGDRLGFLFARQEEEKENELKIVEQVGDLMTRKYNQRSQIKNNSITKTECLNILCQDFGINDVEEYTTLNRTKKELFLFIYRRVMYIFGFNITTKYPEDPAKSDQYFNVFLRFYNRNLDNKTILRTNNKKISSLWKDLFTGSGNKDIYKVPPTPDMTIYVEDPDTAEIRFQEVVEQYKRDLRSDGLRLARIAETSEKLKKQEEKLAKTHKADIPKGFKIQASNKIQQTINRLKDDLARDRMVSIIEEPRFRMHYKAITNPEWEDHHKLLTKGTRREMIERGWLQPAAKPSIDTIIGNIINLLEDGGMYDRKYRVRLDLDRKNMLVECDHNDFWKKIHVVEDSELQKNIDDFLNKTVEMFFNMIDNGMSNKTAKLIRFLCAGQETRILCSMISYYAYGYISKKFLPLRKKHRRDICMLLDKLIK